MKPIQILLFIFIYICLNKEASSQTKTPVEKQHYYSGNMADIYIDKALYTMEGSDKFFFRFTLINKTFKNLGVKLDEYFGMFFPNQWAVSDTNFRMVIDERRGHVKALDEEAKLALNYDFDNGGLETVLAEGSLNWYVSFNGGPAKNVIINPGEFFIGVFDGRLIVTDGTKVEEYYHNMDTYQERELPLAWPVIWLVIPADEKLVFKN